jgi:hypothetical protein
VDRIKKLLGKTPAPYKQGNEVVKFNNSQTNITEIEKAINATGYSVTDIQEK